MADYFTFTFHQTVSKTNMFPMVAEMGGNIISMSKAAHNSPLKCVKNYSCIGCPFYFLLYQELFA